MSIKIDLEKAYDRIKWKFVKNYLEECKIPLISLKQSIIAYLPLATKLCGMGIKLTLSSPLEEFGMETLSPLISLLFLWRGYLI